MSHPPLVVYSKENSNRSGVDQHGQNIPKRVVNVRLAYVEFFELTNFHGQEMTGNFTLFGPA